MIARATEITTTVKFGRACDAFCEGCHQRIRNALIIDDQEPHTHEPDGCRAISRRFYCHTCNHVAVWIEHLDQRLRLTGIHLTPMGFIKEPADVARFIAEHPIVLMEHPVEL